MKKIIFLLILVIAGGFAYYFFSPPHAPVEEEELSSQMAERLTITSYSLEGQVVSLTPTSVKVLVGRVENVGGNNEFVSSEKEFSLADKISLTDGEKNTAIAASALVKSLKVEDRAVFSGTATTSPWSGGTLTVTRIQITSKSGTPLPPPVVR